MSNPPQQPQAQPSTPPELTHNHPQTKNVFEKLDLSVAPMAREDVEQRLDSLHAIDKQIIKLLDLASLAITTLKDGKMCARPVEQAQLKTRLQAAVAEYYTQLEATSIEIRREVRLLNDVSGDKVTPISVVPKATGVGRQKEEEIWRSITLSKEEEEEEVEKSEEGAKTVKNEDTQDDGVKKEVLGAAETDDKEAKGVAKTEEPGAEDEEYERKEDIVTDDETKLGKLRLIAI